MVLKLKISFDGDVRRLPSIPRDFSSLQLEAFKLHEIDDVANRANLVLKYVDDEGDFITLSSTSDFDEALNLAREEQRKSLKLFIFDKYQVAAVAAGAGAGAAESVSQATTSVSPRVDNGVTPLTLPPVALPHEQPTEPKETAKANEGAETKTDETPEASGKQSEKPARCNRRKNFRQKVLDFIRDPKVQSDLPDAVHVWFSTLRKEINASVQQAQAKDTEATPTHVQNTTLSAKAAILKAFNTVFDTFESIGANELIKKVRARGRPLERIAERAAEFAPVIVNFDENQIVAHVKKILEIINESTKENGDFSCKTFKEKMKETNFADSMMPMMSTMMMPPFVAKMLFGHGGRGGGGRWGHGHRHGHHHGHHHGHRGGWWRRHHHQEENEEQQQQENQEQQQHQGAELDDGTFGGRWRRHHHRGHHDHHHHGHRGGWWRRQHHHHQEQGAENEDGATPVMPQSDFSQMGPFGAMMMANNGGEFNPRMFHHMMRRMMHGGGGGNMFGYGTDAGAGGNMNVFGRYGGGRRGCGGGRFGGRGGGRRCGGRRMRNQCGPYNAEVTNHQDKMKITKDGGDASFIVTVKNTGDEAWPEGTGVVHARHACIGPAEIDLPIALPGESIELAIPLSVAELEVGERYHSVYRLKLPLTEEEQVRRQRPNFKRFGDAIHVRVNVVDKIEENAAEAEVEVEVVDKENADVEAEPEVFDDEDADVEEFEVVENEVEDDIADDFDKKLKLLVLMGFPQNDLNLWMLRENDGNVQKAVLKLVQLYNSKE